MFDTIAWSQPSTYTEGTGVHHGYATAKANGDTQVDIRPVSGAVRAISNGWYAKLDPGGFIIPHVDQGPWVERWHYPISGKGRVWQESSAQSQLAIQYINPYRMNHHKPHAVWNPFDEPRIILIVEYDNPVDQPTTDLIICDMIPEVQGMIDAI